MKVNKKALQVLAILLLLLEVGGGSGAFERRSETKH